MLKDRVKLNINCCNCGVSHLCVPHTLQEEEKEELNKIIVKVFSLKKGMFAFHANEKMNNLFAVYSGVCKDYWVDSNGDEHVDNFYFPGDILGLESIPYRKHALSAVALTATQLCVIPVDSLLELMGKNQRLLRRVVDILSYKIANERNVLMTTNAKQRVIDFLVNILYRIEERSTGSHHMYLPMSQLDISNFLGMAHETVSRILHGFVRQKIISIVNNKIYIIDAEQLRKKGSYIGPFGQ